MLEKKKKTLQGDILKGLLSGHKMGKRILRKGARYRLTVAVCFCYFLFLFIFAKK